MGFFFFFLKASHWNKRKIQTGTTVCTKSPKRFELASYPQTIFSLCLHYQCPAALTPPPTPPSHLPANKKKQILILCLFVSEGSCLSISCNQTVELKGLLLKKSCCSYIFTQTHACVKRQIYKRRPLPGPPQRSPEISDECKSVESVCLRRGKSCVSLGHYNSLRSHQSCGVFMSDGLFGWIRFLEKHLRDGLQAAEPWMSKCLFNWSSIHVSRCVFTWFWLIWRARLEVNRNHRSCTGAMWFHLLDKQGSEETRRTSEIFATANSSGGNLRNAEG